MYYAYYILYLLPIMYSAGHNNYTHFRFSFRINMGLHLHSYPLETVNKCKSNGKLKTYYVDCQNVV